MTLLKPSKITGTIIIFLMLTLCVPAIIFSQAASAAPIMDVDYDANANAEQPIHIFANVTSDPAVYGNIEIYYIYSGNNIDYYDEMELISGDKSNGTWHFVIPSQTYEGTLRVRVFATDSDGVIAYVPSNTNYLNINLEGPEPEKPFPWNIVLIIAFLAVTLVATELIFKPGFYRQTGREKAKALEEEDRQRELEEQEK